MQFINVTAEQCNPQGIVQRGTIPIGFFLNVSLIAAIDTSSNIALATGSVILTLNGKYYTNIKLKNRGKIEYN